MGTRFRFFGQRWDLHPNRMDKSSVKVPTWDLLVPKTRGAYQVHPMMSMKQAFVEHNRRLMELLDRRGVAFEEAFQNKGLGANHRPPLL